MISSMNKPNGQTVLPLCGLSDFLSNAKFTKVQGLGGKWGQKLKNLFDVETFSDIVDKIGMDNLKKVVDESTALWIWRTCHGIDFEPVKIVKNVKRISFVKSVRMWFVIKMIQTKQC